MRSELFIPPRFRSALGWLSNQAEEYIAGLSEAIDRTDGSRSSILSALDTPSEVDADELLAALLSLDNYRTAQGLDAEAAADLVVAALGSDAGETRLGALLNSPKLLTLAKASDLSVSYDRVLHTYRLLTDLRPVFPEDVGTQPTSAMIVHQLELSFMKDGRPTSMTISVTPDDLDSMEFQLRRAREKEIQIKEFGVRAGIAVLDQGQFFG